MFKKFLAIFCLSSLLIIACNRSVKQTGVQEFEKEAQALPGYYQQWLYMKTAGSNVLPDMSKYNWDYSSSKRSTSNALMQVYEYGPDNIGGRIRALVVDWSNPNHLIIGGASGGVFVSDNNGASWRTINDQALSPSVTFMDQSPFEANVIYYCTGEASGNSADLLGAGVFKSTDGGNTFSQLPSTDNSNFNQCWSLKCSPKDSNTLYVATHSKGLWRSTDAGLSFTKVFSLGTSQINDIEVLPDGAVLVTIKGSGVYRSNTGNLSSFSKVASISSGNTARGELAYCKNYPHIVYAAISGPDNSYNGVLAAFYKSNDGGKTFVAKTNPNGKVNFGFTWYAMTMGVQENDSNTIFIAGVDAGGSTDGGQSWVSAKEMHADIHVAIGSGNKLYVGSDGGLSLYTWGNFNTYSSLNNGINITQFYAGDVSPHEIAVMGGTQDNGTKQGLNKNQSFGSVFGADGGWCFYHNLLSPIKYYSTQNGIVYRSGVRVSDNLPTTDTKWFIHPYHVSQEQGDILIYPSNRNIYYSNTGGLAFKSLGTIPLGRLYCANTSEGANPAVYTGGQSALVVIDSANNANTQLINLRLKMPNAISASFLSCITPIPGYRDRVYLAFNNVSDSGRLYVLKNALSPNPEYINISGNLPQGLPVNYVECDPMNPETVIFAGTDYGLYVTEDGGVNWIKDTRLPNTVISSIKIHKNKKDIYFFTHGRGIFKGMINNQGISSVHRAVANPRFSVFPVPASDFIQLINNTNTSARYTILDYSGKIVLEGVMNQNIEQLMTSSLSSGNYVLVFEAAGSREYKKFSILH